MSSLVPFTIKSLQKLRAELVEMQKSELTFNSLNDLLPKYRDGLVASGAYHAVSHLLSGQQHVTDVDQLDAARFEAVKIVDTNIIAVDSELVPVV